MDIQKTEILPFIAELECGMAENVQEGEHQTYSKMGLYVTFFIYFPHL